MHESSTLLCAIVAIQESVRLLVRLGRAVRLSDSIIEQSRRSIAASKAVIEIVNLQRQDKIRRGQLPPAAAVLPLVP